MILTVTLNAALDVTYRVERLVRHRSMRVLQVHTQAGGKGVNVARALIRLGSEVRVTGLTGGARGDRIRTDLAELGVDDWMAEMAGESRQTVVIVEAAGEPTEFDEPGPQVTEAEWRRFVGRYVDALESISVVVLSGSLPPGLPGNAYARLAQAAGRHGCRVVLDTAGPSLLAGAAGGPDVVTPTRAELLGATGRAGGRGDTPVLAAAEALRLAGAGAVVVSSGASGLMALTPDGAWRMRHPRVSGNPTGAGDVLVAGIARGLVGEVPWPALLREAAAGAAASVAEPHAGQVDPALMGELLPQVRVRRMRVRTGQMREIPQ